MEWLLTNFTKEAGVIFDAPYSFAIALIFCCVLVWHGIDWRYRKQLDDANSSIKLLERENADYKRKLDGASPDEAKQRLEAFEARVKRMEAELIRLGEVDLVKTFEQGLDCGTF